MRVSGLQKYLTANYGKKPSDQIAHFVVNYQV